MGHHLGWWPAVALASSKLVSPFFFKVWRLGTVAVRLALLACLVVAAAFPMAQLLPSSRLPLSSVAAHIQWPRGQPALIL